jgi:dephospho-CoA kinase
MPKDDEKRVSPHCRKPYTIGLTGNIATGKSTVGKMLVELGAQLIDADRVAHETMMPGGDAYKSVVATFGACILTTDGFIDRQKLGAIVFSEPQALQRLEALVHPPVITHIDRIISASSVKVIVIEAIKLIESGMADSYNAVWVTVCPESVQLTRLIKLRKLEREDALRRLSAQPPQEEKLARADVVIDTSGSMGDTRTQVREAWRRLSRTLCTL